VRVLDVRLRDTGGRAARATVTPVPGRGPHPPADPAPEPGGGFGFDVTASDGGARVGSLRTPHGVIDTPAFVAVGTQAAVKGLDPAVVAATGAQVLFANTYHLYLRPGAELIAELGGLHGFMGWSRPLFTDSGGFQVFSLGASIDHGVGKVASIFPGEAGGGTVAGAPRLSSAPGSMVRVDEHEVRFTSHVDGSRHVFTPEKSIAVQRALGADVILAFDECTSPLHDEGYTRRSMDRTHRWAERCLEAFDALPARHAHPQALFGVVQGGAVEALRRESAAVIGGMPFDGIAIGGNLGRTHADMHRVLGWTIDGLPPAFARHLLGIGDVPGILAAVARGVDSFDCVTPTRNARNGMALARLDDDGAPLRRFRRNLAAASGAHDDRPIEAGCDCSTCARFSRAYLRHLFKSGESLAAQLTTVHNLRFMARFMSEVRDAIRAQRFEAMVRSWLGFDPDVCEATLAVASGGATARAR
jgi:queuine tRNA-ribosyltransferase